MHWSQRLRWQNCVHTPAWASLVGTSWGSCCWYTGQQTVLRPRREYCPCSVYLVRAAGECHCHNYWCISIEDLPLRDMICICAIAISSQSANMTRQCLNDSYMIENWFFDKACAADWPPQPAASPITSNLFPFLLIEFVLERWKQPSLVITNAFKSVSCKTSDQFPSGSKLFALDRAAVDCPRAVSRSTPKRLVAGCDNVTLGVVYSSTRVLVHCVRVLSAIIDLQDSDPI